MSFINIHLSPKQASLLTGIHPLIIYDRLSSGTLPQFRIKKWSPRKVILAVEESWLKGQQRPACKSRHPLYPTYKNMLRRCLNPKSHHYNKYGGRGIKVCDRWIDNFWNFVEDIGDKPSPKHSIGRIDGNGDYCPHNCEWQTAKQQSAEVKSRKL
jgi:hypothetical protein